MNNVPRWQKQPLRLCVSKLTQRMLYKAVFVWNLGGKGTFLTPSPTSYNNAITLLSHRKRERKKKRKVFNNLWTAAYFPIGCPGGVCSTSNPACLSTSITVLLPRKWPKIQVENSTVNQTAPLTHLSFSCWNNKFGRQDYQKLDQLKKQERHIMQFVVIQTQLFTT